MSNKKDPDRDFSFMDDHAACRIPVYPKITTMEYLHDFYTEFYKKRNPQKAGFLLSFFIIYFLLSVPYLSAIPVDPAIHFYSSVCS